MTRNVNSDRSDVGEYRDFSSSDMTRRLGLTPVARESLR